MIKIMCIYDVAYTYMYILLAPQSTSRTRVMSESHWLQNGSGKRWNWHKCRPLWCPWGDFACHLWTGLSPDKKGSKIWTWPGTQGGH